MSKVLPVFPLNLVVFPREKLNLHIFEPRYKQLINDCWLKKTTFGIPPMFDGRLMQIGTEMRIIKIEKTYPSGEMDIKTEAIGVFRIDDFFEKTPNRLYASAQVQSRTVVEDNGDYLSQSRLVEKIKELFKILAIDKPLPTYVSEFQTFDYAHYVGFSMEQECEFLMLTDEQERQKMMREHLRAILPSLRELETVRERVSLNGHFRHITPPKF